MNADEPELNSVRHLSVVCQNGSASSCLTSLPGERLQLLARQVAFQLCPIHSNMFVLASHWGFISRFPSE